jgi:hypothetical protein
LALAALLGSGCTTTAIVLYAYDKLTEGDPKPCYQVSTVERALSARCGHYRPGSLLTRDVTVHGLEQCPLTVAAREPRFWPVLPELVSKGAQPETCTVAPLVALAQAHAADGHCPDFSRASTAERDALRWLAEADARSIDQDVTRMLSCPSARAAGLDRVLDGWLAQGLLPAKGLWFSPLAAVHPDYLESDFVRRAEALGHTARTGAAAGGYEEALRLGHLKALDWWHVRVPELVNQVPSPRAGRTAWVPLARVAGPQFMADAQAQARVTDYLLAHGADPSRQLPHDPTQSVLSYAVSVKSPVAARLEQAAATHARAPSRATRTAAAVVLPPVAVVDVGTVR